MVFICIILNLQFHSRLKPGQIPEPTETDDELAADLKSPYCNLRKGPNQFAGKARRALQEAIDRYCPRYHTVDAEGKVIPPAQIVKGVKYFEVGHDYYDAKPGSEAFVNLRKWTKGNLPTRIIEALQLKLATVSHSSYCLRFNLLLVVRDIPCKS